MIKAALKIGLILAVCVWVSNRAVHAVANWFQWNIDRAYNAGRDMERICSSNDFPETCEKHNSDVNHNIFSE